MSDYREPTAKEWQGMKEMAKDLIASGFLPKDVNSIPKVMAIMLAGRELGVPAMQALRSIQVVKGRPSVAPELMIALAYQKIPGFRLECIESNDRIATFEAQRPGIKPYRHSFTIEQAKRAGLLDKKVDAEYNMWAKYTEAMLRWRCISGILKIVAPDAVLKLYMPEELGAVVDEDGEVISEAESAINNAAINEEPEYEETKTTTDNETVVGIDEGAGDKDIGTNDPADEEGGVPAETTRRISPTVLETLRKKVEEYKSGIVVTCMKDVLRTDTPKNLDLFTLDEARKLYALLQKQPATAKKPKVKAPTGPTEPQVDGQKCTNCGTFVSLSRAVDSRNVYYKILCQECEAKEKGQ